MSIPSWCKRGAKVICVDDRGHRGVLNRGHIYTVISAYPAIPTYGTRGRYANSAIWVTLVEAENVDATDDRSFALERFRPLVTKTQEEDVAEMWKLVRDIPAEGKLDLISELLDQ